MHSEQPEPIKLIQDAIEKACAPDNDLGFAQQTVHHGHLVFEQLRVHSTGTNDWVNLGLLYQALNTIGTVQIFEYRGLSDQEEPRIVADVEIAGEVCQLVYIPNTSDEA